MKIILAYPPNIKEIEEVFDLTGKKPVFAYGDVLFNPHDSHVDQFLMCHEMTHQAQQRSLGSVTEWWKKYLTDRDFRLKQEAEAYHAQYSLLTRKARDRNAVARYLHQIASDFASEMYGEIISYSDAVKMIKYGHC